MFEPDDIEAMSMALDDVCKTLELSNGAKDEREIIARHIIELARRGERNPTLLRDRFLQEFGLTDRMISAAQACAGQAFSILLA